MPSDSAPDDDEVRNTYNFAPGSFGLVYRADVPDHGAGPTHGGKDGEGEVKKDGLETVGAATSIGEASIETHYKLQAMKWGLIPFWTKRNPDYGSMMRTINCRDDSLMDSRSMWTSMKKRKRCIVLCQGFYEWLKKNNGKEKIPHYITRKDGKLMCFAGLWDCVQYEDSEEKHYTYTIITTDSNKQLKFLHDRMPVIFEPGSEALRTWLDPNKFEWTKELQSLLKPYEGGLDIYPVSKDVGKVGNNSPSFIIPLNSTENKSNIVNFFNNQKKAAKGAEAKKEVAKTEEQVQEKGVKVESDPTETRDTTEKEVPENNAPLPSSPKGIKRERSDAGDSPLSPPKPKAQKLSPLKSPSAKTGKKTRSATSNGTVPQASPSKAGQGNQKITKFFGK
jgi:putative SOS response-associated peptidase YedK